MNAPVFISQRVVNTLKSLPEADRLALVPALIARLFACSEGTAQVAEEGSQQPSLTPVQALAFEIICSYVRHDTRQAMCRV